MSIIEMRVPTMYYRSHSQWLKADGEIVNLDDPIPKFESDKAT